jgi:hypothetical protein
MCGSATRLTAGGRAMAQCARSEGSGAKTGVRTDGTGARAKAEERIRAEMRPQGALSAAALSVPKTGVRYIDQTGTVWWPAA